MPDPSLPWCAAISHAILSTSTEPLWATIAPFESLPSLVPELIISGTIEGEGIGMRRTLHLKGGAVAREELIAFHPEQFLFTYSMIVTDGWPWEHYFVTVRLQPLGGHQTHFTASCYFQPRPGQEAACRETFAGVYRGLIPAYARALSAPFAFQP